MLKGFLVSARTHQSTMEAAGDLVLRLFFGLTLAFTHGIGKLPPSAQFIDGVAKLGFPAPDLFAWCAALAEFLGGLALAFGLLTRPAMTVLAFNMAVAAFVQHAADPFHVKEMALMYLAVAVSYLLSGAGKYSLDAIIGKK